MELYSSDTITAISTPIGEGGIGIVRVSGSKTVDCVSKLFQTKDKQFPKPRKAVLGKITDSKGILIDKGIGIYYNNPDSYTGEAVFEFQVHGSSIILNKIVEELISLGCRLAEPGEFTKRAFLNGKIDLLEAEAVIDVIEAKSQQAAVNSEKILEGEFSSKLNTIRDNLKEILIHLESAIDFPEEDIESESFPLLRKRIIEIDKLLTMLLNSYEKGRIYSEGITLTIAGVPNVGKSKLLNRFLGRERAIVSEKAGTTRDFIEELITVKGVPVKIIDTAGIRDSSDLIEQEGVRLTNKKIAESDLILFVIDLTKEISREERKSFEDINVSKRIIVLNKADIVDDKIINRFKESFTDNAVVISAKTGFGMEKLYEVIYNMIMTDSTGDFEGLFISSQRQKNLINESLKNIKSSLLEIDKNSPAEFVALFIRNAIEKIGYLVGEYYNEEILNEIFDRFCIGK